MAAWFSTCPLLFPGNPCDVRRQAVIEKGGDRDIPALTDFLKLPENASMRLCIQGHVNFGKTPADSIKLSDVRTHGDNPFFPPPPSYPLYTTQVVPPPPPESLALHTFVVCCGVALQDRARQIRIRVSSMGIEKERMDCVGFGDSKPRCGLLRALCLVVVSRRCVTSLCLVVVSRRPLVWVGTPRVPGANGLRLFPASSLRMGQVSCWEQGRGEEPACGLRSD
jgi:hypothetical protein